MRMERRDPTIWPRVLVNQQWEEPVPEAKPFDISKQLVWDAYQRVKANRGAAGVDGESLAKFEKGLKGNLYKVWNRMSSGSYCPPPVRRVEIPKENGGVRPLGIPTVGDRVAQTVVKMVLEPLVEPVFHPDSYGYRPGKSALQAVSVARGFAITTILIAALPGYQAWGSASIAALIILRLADGVFVGGEYTAANPLAMEYSPKEKRGLYAGLIHAGYPSALVCVSLLTAFMLKVAPSGGGNAGSAYSVWGWRIPFLIGALLAGALFIYYYLAVPESEVWRSSKKCASPLREIFAAADLRRLGQLIVVMTGAWLTLDATVAALPSVLNTILGVKSPDVNTGIVLSGID